MRGFKLYTSRIYRLPITDSSDVSLLSAAWLFVWLAAVNRMIKLVRACKSLSWHTSRFQRSISTETDIQSPAANSSLSASSSSSCDTNKSVSFQWTASQLVAKWFTSITQLVEWCKSCILIGYTTRGLLVIILEQRNSPAFLSFYSQINISCIW